MGEEVMAELQSTSEVEAGPDQAERLHTDAAAGDDLKSSHHMGRIPVIDLAELDGPGRFKIGEEIAKACESFGFFQVVNHGVDPNIMAKLIHISKGFFHLSHEEKMEYVQTPTKPQGYSYRNMNADRNKLSRTYNDYKFFLSPMSQRKEDLWPSNPPEFRETLIQYDKEVNALAEKLLRVISETLGLPANTLLEKLAGQSGEPGTTILAHLYTPCETDDLLKLDSHTDPGAMTLLLQEESAPGTQVKFNDDWITVEPALNGFCVNVGDQIEIMSNGRFKSIEHRGLGCRGKERVSIPYFYNPGKDRVISPLEALVDEAHPALYRATSFLDYFNLFMRKGTGEGKSFLHAIRNCEVIS